MKHEGDRTHEPGVGLSTFNGGNLENCGVKLKYAQYRDGTGPEGSTYMPSENGFDLVDILTEVKDQDDFIHFLRFCADGLNRGEQVQAIWRDYLDAIAEKSK